MKGETGYLLPYGCAYARIAYKWIFGGLLFLLLRDFHISDSPCVASNFKS